MRAVFLFFKEAFPMPLGTVATRNAGVNARSFYCHKCSLFLLTSLTQIKHEQC